MSIVYEPIGIIRTKYKNKAEVPIQPVFAKDSPGTLEIDQKFVEGLKDLEGFSHIYLIYHFHKSSSYKLKVTPFLDDEERGVFSTRAPQRPNAVGISVVKLVKISGNIIEIENADIIDKTPLLDIKPYIPEFDVFKKAQSGWLKNLSEKNENIKSDDRFN